MAQNLKLHSYSLLYYQNHNKIINNGTDNKDIKCTTGNSTYRGIHTGILPVPQRTQYDNKTTARG